MPLQQGAYSLVPPVFTAFGWISAIVQDGCDFALIKDVDTLTQGEVPFVQAGMKAYRTPYYDANEDAWRVRVTGACTAYPDEVLSDPRWNISKICAFVAQVLGGAATFYLWCITCCVFSKGTWRWAGFQVFLAACFQVAGVLLWFTNDLCKEGSCQWSYGMKFDIAAAVFWFAGSVAIFCHYPEAKGVYLVDEEDDGIIRQVDDEELGTKEEQRLGLSQQSGERSNESQINGEMM